MIVVVDICENCGELIVQHHGYCWMHEDSCRQTCGNLPPGSIASSNWEKLMSETITRTKPKTRSRWLRRNRKGRVTI